MVAKRITIAVDASGIAGDLQNGFRPKRRCADNIFIANTLLDLNRQKKLLSYLMFVDLKEAYDMVDRGILFRKLQQYNFPPQLINYLQEYYFADCISTSSAGKKSSTLYQTRGLRQGCNLSSILFVIYLCELSRRLNAAKLGISLSVDLLIAYLLFADDIILLGHNEDEISALKTILEIWCMDFRMRIGAKKTQLITPISEKIWSIIDVTTGDIQDLETVESYKYLGINQKITLRKTANAKGKAMISKANYYASTILRLKSTVPDKLEVYRATWENIATPAILYGADVLPVTMDTINELEMIQRRVGKAVLGVPTNSANEVVELELGIKPFLLKILSMKINFFLSTKSDKTACNTTKLCLEILECSGDSEYIKNFNDLLSPFGLSVSTLTDSSISVVNIAVENRILEGVRAKTSLSTVPLTGSFWKPSPHLSEGLWSSTITRFRCQSVGLGNRTNIYKNYAEHNDEGRVVQCPLCSIYKNNEIHILKRDTKLTSQQVAD